MAKAKKIIRQKIHKSEFKPNEWIEPKKGTKWPKEERRRYLKNLSVELGLYNVNKTEVAQKMGISRWQIYHDIEGIFKEGLDPSKLSSATIEINAQLGKICKEMHKILVQGKTTGEKVRAAACLLDATEKHIDFLERFGIKDITTPISDSIITVMFGKDPKEKK